jgi:hypothetical protein
MYKNIFIQICCIYIEGKYLYEQLCYCNSFSICYDNYNNVYALLAPIFFESDNTLGEGEAFVVNNDKIMMYNQQTIEEEVETKECKSPCSSTAEMCIEICR